jgi:hypothetical protein
MIKKGFITAIAGLIIILSVSYITGIWGLIYYLPLVIAGASMAVALDFLICRFGNKKASTPEKKDYIEGFKKSISVSIPNLIAIFIYIIN